MPDSPFPPQGDLPPAGGRPDNMTTASKFQGRSSLANIHWYARLGAIFSLVLVVGVIAGMLVERNLIAVPPAPAPQFKDLEAVTSIIEDNYYYRPTDPTEEAVWKAKLEQQSISGMLGSLDDQYTRYLEPNDARTASNQLAGKYEGIGISIAAKGNQVVITDIFPGGPASQAGITVGDIILSVDDRPVAAGDDISSQIQGPVGSQVTLELMRPGMSQPQHIRVTRQEIITPPVTFSRVPNTGYAVIRVSLFGDQTTHLVTTFLQQATQEHATGIVLDLRGNGGGWVTSAAEVIGRFIPSDRGPALFEDTASAAGGEVPLPIVNGASPVYTGPLVVLVDDGTASAAEIVAGALKDYDRALIVGRKTYGKGSVQRIYDFQDGASMRVTVAEWLTPSRGRIQAVGILPNIGVTLAERNQTGKDADLAQAIALLDAGQSKPSDLTRGPAAIPAGTPIPHSNPDPTEAVPSTP